MKKLLILLASGLILSGCDQTPPETVTTSSSAKTVQNYNEIYSTIIPQPTSEIRGISSDYTNSQLDLDQMEMGLVNITKNYVDTGSNYYVPGQVLTEQEGNYLLQRTLTTEQLAAKEEEDYEYQNIGLNPVLKDEKNPEASKVYVSTIIEQDYGKYNNDQFELDTISIGIGIDTTYEFKKDGKTQTVQIEDDELYSYVFPDVSAKLIAYLRSREDTKDVNIIIGFFKQSENDLLPGNYKAYGQVKSGESSVEEIIKVNNETILYPSEEGGKYDEQLNKEITELNSKLLSYFTQFAGISAYGSYENDEISLLEIQINANFYSTVDATTFTSYLKDEIRQTLSNTTNIKVYISASNGDPVSIIIFDQKGEVSSVIY